jgi:uncharacterized repeat protein (TIGR02543 family)
MKHRKNSIYFICLSAVLTAFWGCEGMATLFHGPKPEEEKPSYTVTFDANGASGAVPAQKTAASGEAIVLPGEGGLTRGGDVFTGWNISKSGGGTTYPPESSYTVTADQTFYAQWTDPAQVYTVTYNANGAGGAPPSQQKVLQNGSIAVADKGSLANGNKSFTGWNTAVDGTGTNYNAGDTLAVSANVTLYAQWIDPSAQRYTVTYHANGAGGTPPAKQTVNEGASITLPGAGGLTYSGKTFAGWNTAANGSGTSYTAGAAFTVNADTTFYAQWVNEPVTPSGATLAEKFAYIAGQADDGAVYDIEVTQNEYLSPTTVATQGRNVTVNLRSADAGDIKTISITGNGFVFTIDSNITLKLSNIVISGHDFNTSALIKAGLGGTLTLDIGAKITKNTNNSTGSFTGGGGVFVDGGSVNILGGEISNTKISDGYNRTGGGIFLTNQGTLTMKGGKISDNEGRWGGGVCVHNSTFIMSGGVISGNRNTGDGAGAGIDIEGGTFTKTASGGNSTSGTIHGSNAVAGLANIPGTNGGAAIAYYIGTALKGKVDRTLGEYDEISTINLSVGWD